MPRSGPKISRGTARGNRCSSDGKYPRPNLIDVDRRCASGAIRRRIHRRHTTVLTISRIPNVSGTGPAGGAPSSSSRRRQQSSMVALSAGSRMISVVTGDLNCGSRPETAPASTSGIALFSEECQLIGGNGAGLALAEIPDCHRWDPPRKSGSQ